MRLKRLFTLETFCPIYSEVKVKVKNLVQSTNWEGLWGDRTVSLHKSDLGISGYLHGSSDSRLVNSNWYPL
jgi:hypothetical protein